MDMSSALQGNIEKFTLAEIFQLLAAGKKAGTLGIQREDSIVMVYFEKGDVIYGYGPRQTFHIGQLLREKKRITEPQLEEAIAIQTANENSKRLGEILLGRGYIDNRDLNEVVTAQIEELLFSLLGWTTGTFKFYENQFPTDEEITVRLSVENVILEGARRLDEMQFINDTLPNLDRVLTIAPATAGRRREIAMDGEEWTVLSHVDGYRNISEICRASTLDRHRTLRILAQMKLAGIVTLAEPKLQKNADPLNSRSAEYQSLEPMLNRLAGLLEEYVQEKPVNRLTERRITTQSIR